MTKKKVFSRLRCSIPLILAAIILLPLLCGGGYLVSRRIQPGPTQKMLFQGVEYIRDVRTSPRPIIIHVIKVELLAQGVRVLVTPGDPDAELPLQGRTTSQFLQNFGLQVAINGDGFTPWHSRTILDYYPHVGDPVDVFGEAASDGIIYSQDTANEPTLYFAPTNRASFNIKYGKTGQIISGNRMLVKNGKAVSDLAGSLNPRTAVALNRSNEYLILFVVDGRQPGYSEGVTLEELANIIIHHGGHNAMNLDGGGSSAMAIEGALGNANVLNSPINNRIPGRERVVGNHLGIYAKPLP